MLGISNSVSEAPISEAPVSVACISNSMSVAPAFKYLKYFKWAATDKELLKRIYYCEAINKGPTDADLRTGTKVLIYSY